jgi:hypothetical protein
MSKLKAISGLYKLLSTSAYTALVLLLFVPTCVSAQSQVQSGSISQGFVTDESKVAEGALMSLRSDNAGSVELAGASSTESLVGVVSSNSLVELGGDGNVRVITSGTAYALVSDIAGDIRTGDKITTSPILGVGKKASGGTVVIGTALADFTSISTTQHSITDASGTARTVKIGLLPTQVDVSFYAATGAQGFVPTFLQEFANSVAGKQVGVVQLFISILVLLLAFVSVGVLLYGSVKSSIISIGRNPLSEHYVRKGLWQASFAVMGILAAAITIVLLVLRI